MVTSAFRSAFLVVLLASGVARAQSRPVPELADYAVLGLGDVTIRAVTPGASDFRLPPHTGAAPVAAGSFRDVTVGRGSVLQLDGGTYAMGSLRVRRDGRVVCVTECRIGVLGTVTVGPGAALGALAPLRSNLVRIDIAASGPLPVFIARARANVSATVFAPAGDVILGPQGSYRGAVVGRTVAVGPAATLRVDSAL
ncbi:MAG TPA: hypothetical protein VKU61_00990 [Candidatus Binatia bacterium]|nr:hypothetical protein [Candidatus Binatia bacterium]